MSAAPYRPAPTLNEDLIAAAFAGDADVSTLCAGMTIGDLHEAARRAAEVAADVAAEAAARGVEL